MKPQSLVQGDALSFETHILSHQKEVEGWFREAWHRHEPPFYASVDIRVAGFKVAPVDTNLFPGGFNNLSPTHLALCVQAAEGLIEKYCPSAKRLLLIPESHTRNKFYLENVLVLKGIFEKAGLEVRLGTLMPVEKPFSLILDGKALLLEPLSRRANRLGVEGFDPCLVLLNNDLAGGIPDILRGIEQALLPPLHLGWATRRKSLHFDCYSKVAEAFCRDFSLDPWLLVPDTKRCGGVDFLRQEGLANVASTAEEILARMREKYRTYGIESPPFVVVKANAGTYGMGVMTVKSAEELYHLNRKQRNKMAVVKEGVEVHEVLVQEGVPTMERVDGAVAEPVVYLMDRHVVGGFYRVHTQKGPDENLNAPGMHFIPLPFETACILPDPEKGVDYPPNRFYAYGVVARLACLASSLESEEMLIENEACL